jgi:hypothetical protein
MFRAEPLPENVYRTDLEAARRMGIPLTVHISSRATPPKKGACQGQSPGKGCPARARGLGTPDELKMVKDAGATISTATTSDLRIGSGLPPVSDFLSAGIPCGTSLDSNLDISNSSVAH